MVGSNIADKADRGRMDRGESEKLAATGTRFPLRNLLAILESRVQDVDRTTKDASATKIVAAGTSATEELDWGKTVSARNMIV